MARKMVCPKCGNDTFKLSIGEEEATIETRFGTRKVMFFQLLFVICAKCSWSTKKMRPKA